MEQDSRSFLLSISIMGSNLNFDEISCSFGLPTDKQDSTEFIWVSETLHSQTKDGVAQLFDDILEKMKPNHSKIVNLMSKEGIRGRVCLSLNIDPWHGWEEIDSKHLKALGEFKLSLCLGVI